MSTSDAKKNPPRPPSTSLLAFDTHRPAENSSFNRRLKFTVEAYNEEGTKIGEGLHERAVIDISRFSGE